MASIHVDFTDGLWIKKSPFTNCLSFVHCAKGVPIDLQNEQRRNV